MYLKKMISPILALALSACSVTLISPYDEVTDNQVSQLQKDVDGFLISLTRNSTPPGCTHAKHQEFYTGVFTSISSLLVRNEGRPKNTITLQQLKTLEDSIEVLEGLHKVKGDNTCLSPQEIDPIRRNLNSSFSAIMKLELAKKERGNKGE